MFRMKNESVEWPKSGLKFGDGCEGVRLPALDTAEGCLPVKRPDEDDEEWDGEKNSDQPDQGGK